MHSLQQWSCCTKGLRFTWAKEIWQKHGRSGLNPIQSYSQHSHLTKTQIDSIPGRERAWWFSWGWGAKNCSQMTNKIEQINFKFKPTPSPTLQETLPHPPSLPRPLSFLTQQLWQNGLLQEGNGSVKPVKDQHLPKLQTDCNRLQWCPVAHQFKAPDVWHSSKTATIPGTSCKGITSFADQGEYDMDVFWNSQNHLVYPSLEATMQKWLLHSIVMYIGYNKN